MDAVWTKKDYHLAFFSYLGKELGYQQLEDWYKLQREDIENYGGGKLLKKFYDNSPFKVLFQLCSCFRR